MKWSQRRQKIGLKGELLLALMPTLTVLLVLAFIETLSRQRLLFASLASSAFLIYLDPGHTANNVRTLLFAQISASVIGVLLCVLLGPGYLSAGLAMLSVIFLMVFLDMMHPPAISTALGFGLRASGASNLLLFCMALCMTAVLVLLQLMALWIVRRTSV
jgi:CBS-domain-containing membrane protein